MHLFFTALMYAFCKPVNMPFVCLLYAFACDCLSFKLPLFKLPFVSQLPILCRLLHKGRDKQVEAAVRQLNRLYHPHEPQTEMWNHLAFRMIRLRSSLTKPPF